MKDEAQIMQGLTVYHESKGNIFFWCWLLKPHAVTIPLSHMVASKLLLWQRADISVMQEFFPHVNCEAWISKPKFSL